MIERQGMQHDVAGRHVAVDDATDVLPHHAAVREHGLVYSRFIDGLTKAGIAVDRKVLSDLAITEPAAFASLVAKAKAAIA